jgi:acyl-CoA synthetase (AMP-forming)/AMP-acid ligase II
MLEVLSREYPDRVAIVDAEQDIRRTYAQFAERANRVADALWRIGVRPGDNFGLLMHNCAEFLEVLYGAAKIGATAVLVNRRLSVAEMAYELEDSESVGLIYSSRFADSAAELRARIDRPLWWCASGESPAPGSGRQYELETLLSSADPGFTALTDVDLESSGWVIIYTSGTTGKPKGVVLTQGNVIAGNEIVSRFLWSRYGAALTPVVRALVTAAMNHIGGLTTSSTPVLASGGMLVILDDFDPVKMLRTIERYRLNLAFSIGNMWNRIAEENIDGYDLSSLEVIGTCISYHNDQQLRFLHERVGAEVYYMFGQTETTTGLVTTRKTSDLFLRRGTLGRPFGYMDVRVVSETGKPVPVGEVGELQYRGTTVFKEYYGRPDDTKRAFDNGWFRSGDLVRADEDGYLYFVDRLKDMVKTGGLNVFTIEVENVLLGHDGVAEVAVAGIPDPKWGEAVVAFVVPEPGVQLTKESMIDFCKQRIAHYKSPKHVYFLDQIPENSLGKKLKRQLVDSVLAGNLH